MIKLIILIAILSLAVIAGPFTSESQGFVHIAAGNYIIETSLTSAVLIAIIFTSALFIILSIIKRFIKILSLRVFRLILLVAEMAAAVYEIVTHEVYELKKHLRKQNYSFPIFLSKMFLET